MGQVTALAREKAGIKGKMSKEDTQKEFSGARVVFGDVTDVASISGAAFDQPADVVVCCLASRTGAHAVILCAALRGGVRCWQGVCLC
jgi:divinyl chlorophyllide a 8-vinyl-reductase